MYPRLGYLNPLISKKDNGRILMKIPDSFSKIVVVRDYLKPWRDEVGIIYMGIEQFLLDEDI